MRTPLRGTAKRVASVVCIIAAVSGVVYEFIGFYRFPGDDGFWAIGIILFVPVVAVIPCLLLERLSWRARVLCGVAVFFGCAALMLYVVPWAAALLAPSVRS